MANETPRCLRYIERARFPVKVIFALSPLLFLAKFDSAVSVDEMSSIVDYASHWQTLAYRDWPNNHFLTTVLGYLYSNVFSYDTFAFRLVNVSLTIVFFLGLLIFLQKRSYNLYFVFVMLLMVNEWVYLYSVLYRGYLLQSLLCTAGVALSFGYALGKTKRFLSASNLIFAISFVHVPTTVYLWVPVVLTTAYLCRGRGQIVAQLRSFLYPVLFLVFFESIFIVVTGYGDTRPINASIDQFINTIFTRSGEVLLNGFTLIFLHPAIESSSLHDYLIHLKDLVYSYPVAIFLAVVMCFLVPGICYRRGIIERRAKTFIQILAVTAVLAHVALLQTPPTRVYMLYVCPFSFLVAYIATKFVEKLPGKTSLKIEAYLLPYFCLIVIVGAHWNFRGIDLNLPSNFSSVVEKVVKENPDAIIDGTGIIKKYIAFFTQVRDSDRWALYETRNFTRGRKALEADIFIVETRLTDWNVPEGYNVIWRDGNLIVYQRRQAIALL